jgi:hypothetical protein
MYVVLSKIGKQSFVIASNAPLLLRPISEYILAIMYARPSVSDNTIKEFIIKSFKFSHNFRYLDKTDHNTYSLIS